MVAVTRTRKQKESVPIDYEHKHKHMTAAIEYSASERGDIEHSNKRIVEHKDKHKPRAATIASKRGDIKHNNERSVEHSNKFIDVEPSIEPSIEPSVEPSNEFSDVGPSNEFSDEFSDQYSDIEYERLTAFFQFEFLHKKPIDLPWKYSSRAGYSQQDLQGTMDINLQTQKALMSYIDEYVQQTPLPNLKLAEEREKACSDLSQLLFPRQLVEKVYVRDTGFTRYFMYHTYVCCIKSERQKVDRRRKKVELAKIKELDGLIGVIDAKVCRVEAQVRKLIGKRVR